VDLSGEACNFDKRDQEDPLRWLLCQAEQSIELPSPRKHQDHASRAWKSVSPTRVIAFSAWPGEGCEASNFGLCQYPAVVQSSAGPVRTKLSGWCWSSFCKTQYASDPNCGGVQNFLRCHLTVIAMLDHAKKLGCLESASDESGFWEKRDVEALVKEIGSWNEMIAAFGGKLKDMLGDGLESAISQYPNFEQLEAAGQIQLPTHIEKLGQLIQRVVREAA
jgi:hypothetical protein